jgi:hypothetical protein
MRRIPSRSPVLQRGVGRGIPFPPPFPPAALGSAPLAGKVEEEKTIEGAPALKHGANENSLHCFLKVTNLQWLALSLHPYP